MYGNKLTDLYAKNEFHSTFGTRDNKRTIESGFSQPSKIIKLCPSMHCNLGTRPLLFIYLQPTYNGIFSTPDHTQQEWKWACINSGWFSSTHHSFGLLAVCICEPFFQHSWGELRPHLLSWDLQNLESKWIGSIEVGSYNSIHLMNIQGLLHVSEPAGASQS